MFFLREFCFIEKNACFTLYFLQFVMFYQCAIVTSNVCDCYCNTKHTATNAYRMYVEQIRYKFMDYVMIVILRLMK